MRHLRAKDQTVTYLLIIVTTISGFHESYLRVTPDLEACMFKAETVKRNMESIQSEWRLKARCVPIGKSVEA
jgi:hypothetical protein